MHELGFRRAASAGRRGFRFLMLGGGVTAALGTWTASAAPIRDEVQILKLEDRRAPVASLIPYLESTQAETRARACLAVGRIAGPAEVERTAAAPAGWLAARLREDVSPRVRRDAAFALGLLGTSNAGAVLAQVLIAGNERDAEVREAAADGLGRCGPGPHALAIDRALRDPAPRVVQAALLAVWRGPGSAALDRVLELSRDRDPEVRWRAAYALMRLLGAPTAGRTPATTNARLTDDERDRILWRMQELAADADPRVVLQAVRALGTRAGGAILSSGGGAAVAQTLLHPDPRVRVEALRSLGTLLAGAGECEGLDELLRDHHPHVRIALIQAAGRILHPPALMALLDSTFISPSVWERATAFETAIAAQRGARDFAAALRLVERGEQDADWTVRYATAAALAEWFAAVESDSGATAQRDSLVAAMGPFRHDDPRVAKAVATEWVAARAARSQAGDPASLPSEVEPLLTQDDDVLRALALDGLNRHLERLSPAAPGDGGVASGVDPARFDPVLRRVIALTHDPSSNVRASLVALLGRCLSATGDARAGQALLEIATGDPDRRLREAAILALRDLPEGSPWRGRAAGLEPGPQETGWKDADYQRAFSVARAAREALIETGNGSVRVRLLGAVAPLTVYNFVRLTRRGFFDDGAWHRVVPDFVVQDGCPRHDGWGDPGYAIRCEINRHHYETGTLAMALSGKDTGGSQFFFTLADQPHLDGRYTIFGRVLEGQAILNQIAQGEPIRRVEILFDGPEPKDLR
jgi:cyclophilin family peptidyl-prolyl cis-trans isomerase/HEAT repeat protein